MNYLDRDISWLSFNERILQEAETSELPVGDQLKFLAIYSSNLEEFFRVRVASHRFAQRFNGDKKNKFGYKPSLILSQISEIVDQQQQRFGNIFKSIVLPRLKENGIELVEGKDLTENEKQAAQSLFEDVWNKLSLIEITEEDNLQLENQAVYLYLVGESRQWLVHMDYKQVGRFHNLSNSETQRIIQLDDLIKLHLPHILPVGVQAYAIKVSRDAELYVQEGRDVDMVKSVKKSLKKRETGLPSRLLFDENISFRDINILRKKTLIDLTGMIPGGRYHNFYDFFGFPMPDHLESPKMPAVQSRRLDNNPNWFEEIEKGDVFLSFPYQPYSYVTEFISKICSDPKVTKISITLYRVASDSRICEALASAAESGKEVFVLSEIQARFDEASNISWGERLEKAGATVRYGVPKLKVHAKVCLVEREDNGVIVKYAYLGTGNFNEKTAGIYADHAILTKDKELCNDLSRLFQFLDDSTDNIEPKELLIAPFSLRQPLIEKIQREIQIAKAGGKAKIQLKLNSLEDPEMIDWLREAAEAGVQIDLVVRGICCLYPANPKQSKNIRAVSVIDGFLEHTRIYAFHNEGNKELYLSSADWMTRNLSKRIEVAFPIKNPHFKQFLFDQMTTQLADSVKGRQIFKKNAFVEGNGNSSSQKKMFEMVQNLEEL